MITIVVGLDGCGKTTAMSILQDRRKDIIFIKESYPGTDLDARLFRMNRALFYGDQSDVQVFYDRATIIDDIIYQPLIERRGSMFASTVLSPVVVGLLQRCCIIYLKCDLEVLKRRLADRGDCYVGVGDLLSLEAAYKAFFQESALPVVEIDVTKMLPEQIANAIETASVAARKTKKRARVSGSFRQAHIVPRRLLETTADNTYHMCLAHLVKESDEYAAFYRRMSDEGRFVLMDNGAAEDAQLSLDDLVECYKKVLPAELILPDTLYDRQKTVLRAAFAVDFFRSHGVQCSFMAVPQGRDLLEWCLCAQDLLGLSDICSLGISKFLTMRTADPRARYRAAAWLENLFAVSDEKGISVHLLGCDAGPTEVAEIRNRFGFVRGCDTALAFICAQAGVSINGDTARPAGEIDFLEGFIDQPLLESALRAFDRAVGISD